VSAAGACDILLLVPTTQVADSAAVDPEAAAVERFQAGDEAAFEELVSRREAEVYRLARRMLGDEEDALEATQDAFLRAYRALPRFRGDAAFRTWLFGIAINVCRSRLASRDTRNRRRTIPLDAGDPGDGDAALVLPAAPGPDPERAAHGAELGKALERALAGLSPEHREILLLREMQGLEYEELAATLACAVGTVKSRLARARGALRTAMESVWP
jgi:RNA polymerase sigma-70 factor (ECF subfamily)